MPRVITEDHQWVVAANIDVTDKQAKYAVRRGNFYIDNPVKVEALLVSCAMCRKPYEQIADEPCAAYIDNRHLIGGRPDGSRNRMKLTGTDGETYQLDDDEGGGVPVPV